MIPDPSFCSNQENRMKSLSATDRSQQLDLFSYSSKCGEMHLGRFSDTSHHNFDFHDNNLHPAHFNSHVCPASFQLQYYPNTDNDYTPLSNNQNLLQSNSERPDFSQHYIYSDPSHHNNSDQVNDNYHHLGQLTDGLNFSQNLVSSVLPGSSDSELSLPLNNNSDSKYSKDTSMSQELNQSTLKSNYNGSLKVKKKDKNSRKQQQKINNISKNSTQDLIPNNSHTNIDKQSMMKLFARTNSQIHQNKMNYSNFYPNSNSNFNDRSQGTSMAAITLEPEKQQITKVLSDLLYYYSFHTSSTSTNTFSDIQYNFHWYEVMKAVDIKSLNHYFEIFSKVFKEGTQFVFTSNPDHIDAIVKNLQILELAIIENTLIPENMNHNTVNNLTQFYNNQEYTSPTQTQHSSKIEPSKIHNEPNKYYIHDSHSIKEENSPPRNNQPKSRQSNTNSTSTSKRVNSNSNVTEPIKQNLPPPPGESIPERVRTRNDGRWRDSQLDDTWAFAFPLIHNIRLIASKNINIRWARERTAVGGSWVVGKGRGYCWRESPSESSPEAVRATFCQALEERNKMFGPPTDGNQSPIDYSSILTMSIGEASYLQAEELKKAADGLLEMHRTKITNNPHFKVEWDLHLCCFIVTYDNGKKKSTKHFRPAYSDAIAVLKALDDVKEYVDEYEKQLTTSNTLHD